MRSFVAIAIPWIMLALVSCGAPKNTAPINKYPLKGEVISLDPGSHSAKIKHGKIEGWMGAMTMEYPVKDEAEFKKLAPGETITATVFVQGQDFWVGDISPGSK